MIRIFYAIITHFRFFECIFSSNMKMPKNDKKIFIHFFMKKICIFVIVLVLKKILVLKLLFFAIFIIANISVFFL